MICESGRVVAIEPQGLWVETIQASACGKCQAQKGCGHSMMGKLGAKSSYLWVLFDGRNSNDFAVGQLVQVGVPEDLVVSGSVFIYMVPVVAMVLATAVAHHYFLSDGASIVGALIGLMAGAFIVRWRSHQNRFDPRLQPTLIDAPAALTHRSVVAVCPTE